MISYKFKLIIFSIILGTLTLIYNNDCERLYKHMKHKKLLCVQTKFRSLAEFSYEPTQNYKHGSNKLREYGNRNEIKYKKNNYPKDDAKRKYDIPEVSEMENNATPNLMIYTNGTYDIEKEEQSNISSRSLKYLEVQRKLYNNFYLKPEICFEKFSDKANDKFCEYSNKKKMCNQLYIRNKVDIYPDNLKKVYVGSAGICVLSSASVAKCGITAGATAAAEAAIKAAVTTVAGLGTKLTGKLIGAKFFCISSLKTTIESTAASLNISINPTVATTIANSAASAGITAFFPYAMEIVAIIAVTIIVILLYVWLRKRRKNSWKYEYKKHLST